MPAGDSEAVIHRLSGAPVLRDNLRTQSLDTLLAASKVYLEKRAREGRQPANVIMDGSRVGSPVDAAFRLFDLARISDSFCGLRLKSQTAPRQGCERPHHKVRADEREPVMEIARRVFSANRRPLDHADRTRVEALLHFHHHDASIRIARHDGALDRSCAAPARQQGGMKI